MSSALAAQGLDALDSEIAAIISSVSGSVVTVEARMGERSVPLYTGASNRMGNPISTVVGSGILIDSLGHILTIQSLVEGFDDFRVEIDSHSLKAELVGIDRRLNLAVLRVIGLKPRPTAISPYPPLSGRLALAYGRSIGQTGYPSLGVIAGRQNDGNFLMSGTVLPGLLGGGVFDLSGRLIGIITAGTISGPEQRQNVWGGIIMVPSGAALTAAERIINFGNREAGYLGVRTTTIELVSEEGVVLGEAVVIADVAAESPAALAGLAVGDIITNCAHISITSDRQLQQLITAAGSDSTVTIEFIRGNRQMGISIALSTTPKSNMYLSNGAGSKSSTKEILAAFELQQKIDSMKTEMTRLQIQLDRLINRFSSPR